MPSPPVERETLLHGVVVMMRGKTIVIATAAAMLATPIPALAAGEGTALADFQAAARPRLMRADANRDGKISKEEWVERRRDVGRKDPARMFDRLDTNHDGSVEASEIDAQLARRFKRLDANGDGLLMPEERKAGRKAADD